MSETQTINPGYLVSLKASVRGGVSYETTDKGEQIEGKSKTTAWETIKHVTDVDEVKTATEICNKARNMIRAKCIATPFGLLCPKSNLDELNQIIVEGKAIASKHNATARHTQVEIYVLKGEIASNDKEAARAILSDLKSAVEQMKEGIKNTDVEQIRQASTRAKQLSKMLNEKQGEVVSTVIKAARNAATTIAARVIKKGESAKKVILELNLDPVNGLRFANLDTDDSDKTPTVSLPKVDKARFEAIDTD